jgi:uncharacterized Zn finger protein (UPF0148 family)
VDDVIAGYAALRALLEDMAARRAVDADALGAIRTYLQIHCRSCGAVLPESLRRQGQAHCAWCAEPARAAIRRGMAGEDDDDDDVPFR